MSSKPNDFGMKTPQGLHSISPGIPNKAQLQEQKEREKKKSSLESSKSMQLFFYQNRFFTSDPNRITASEKSTL